MTARTRIARMLAVMTLTAALSGIAQPTSADQITDHITQAQRQLAQVKSQIATLEAEIAAARNGEARLTSIISGLNTRVAATQAQVASTRSRLAAIDVQMTAARSRLAEARALLGADRQQLSEELVVIYEFQNQSTPLHNLLSSGGSFNQFWTDVIDSRRISDREQQTVHQVDAQRVDVEADIGQIGAEQQQQQATLARLVLAEDSLNGQVSARQQAIAYLTALQAQDQVRAQQWEAAAHAINGQIAQLQQEEQQALAAGGGNGHFVWPDLGPISQGFGCTPYYFEPYDPNCPQRHFHNGLDIAGPCGHHVVAADSGIAHIEPFMSYGYGNYIIMVHGNGWETLYGHLAAFAIHNGQTVTRGQLIGYEGTTGNSTGCHLHFSVNHDNQWVNPLAYLP